MAAIKERKKKSTKVCSNIYIELEIIKQNSRNHHHYHHHFLLTLSKAPFFLLHAICSLALKTFSKLTQKASSSSFLFAHDKLLISQSCVHFFLPSETRYAEHWWNSLFKDCKLLQTHERASPSFVEHLNSSAWSLSRWLWTFLQRAQKKKKQNPFRWYFMCARRSDGDDDDAGWAQLNVIFFRVSEINPIKSFMMPQTQSRALIQPPPPLSETTTGCGDMQV